MTKAVDNFKSLSEHDKADKLAKMTPIDKTSFLNEIPYKWSTTYSPCCAPYWCDYGEGDWVIPTVKIIKPQGQGTRLCRLHMVDSVVIKTQRRKS